MSRSRQAAARGPERASACAAIAHRVFDHERPVLWALDVLIEEGYGYDTSIFPDPSRSLRHPRRAAAPVHRVERPAGRSSRCPPFDRPGRPASNLPIAGGGYFRLLPYEWTRWGIARVNRVERQPVMFYLHPWEVDPDQPRLPSPRASRIRHYTGLKTNGQRLEQLLQSFGSTRRAGSVLDRAGWRAIGQARSAGACA